MTDRIKSLLTRTFDKEQKKFRRDVDWQPLLRKFIEEGIDDETRARMGLEAMLAAETPAFMEGETIHFLRTVIQIPDLHSEEEMNARRAAGTAFGEKGVVFNLTADFATTIAAGLDARLDEMERRLDLARGENDAEGVNFLENAILSVRAVLDLADRYGIDHVPHKGARTFHEALQFLRILHYAMWCEGEYHCGLGRIDQYLFPYYEADIRAGRLTDETALEEIEEFFIACNRDSDLYIGVQQGDNGQSVMLGGKTRDGTSAFNALSRLFLRACGELKLVDPKINLRVDKTTPLEIFEEGTRLTKEGLGFPQYANDDVVIPALKRWGYAPEDALNYTVAACWEFIIPGCGLDIANIDAVSFAGCLDTALRQLLAGGKGENASFDDVKAAFKAEVLRRADAIVARYRHVEILPGPFVSVLSDGCVERARDICKGAKYNNFGIHGTGIAVAADSLASIRELVFEKKLVSLPELVRLLDTDFAGRPDVLAAAKAAPKMGNADARADEFCVWLLEFWGHAFDGRKNDRGGIFRPGTGTAMNYIRHAVGIPASPDGRLRGEPLPANYAPALGVQVKGPVSVVRSFTEADLVPVCNGGPLTIELHDSVFAFDDGVTKVADLVRFFILRGGHQIQLNTINRETLLDAQKHPDKYRHLIVRVWGWSGYFVELDREYQDQIIRRVELRG